MKKVFIALITALFFSIPSGYAQRSELHEVTLEGEGFFLNSPLIVAEAPFNVVVFTVPEKLFLEVNFHPQDPEAWEPVELHDDGYGLQTLMFTSPARAFQLRGLSMKALDSLTVKVDLNFEDASVAAARPSALFATQGSTAAGLKIISRAEWGADEALRYWNPDSEEGANGNGDKDKPASASSDACSGEISKLETDIGITKVIDRSSSGDLLVWPVSYMKSIKKIVVHHTDSDLKDLNGDSRMDGRDYSAMVRAIYRYHTVTRGWGDIGYNYIVDPLGNIYEGRFGGDGAIGAHVLCHNNGAIGISIIGNYEENTVPEPAADAVIQMAALKAHEFNIDPQGESSFHGKMMPNILGHRDLRATACPGKNLYALLPLIRDRASLISRFTSFSDSSNVKVDLLDYNAQPLTTLEKMTLLPNERRHVSIQFKNTGKQTWDSNTWLHVALNNNPNARIVPIIPDKAFVAGDLREGRVEPGNVGTFEFEIEGGYNGGVFSFAVAPVANGRFKISKAAMNIAFSVENPKYDYEVATSGLPSGILYQGQRITSFIDLKNTGNVVWKNYGTHQMALGTTGPQDRHSILVGQNPSRLGYLVQSEVRPGEVGRFVLALEAPEDKKGLVKETFAPVIEGLKWFPDKNLNFEVTLQKPRHQALITQKDDVTRMTPGEMRKFTVTYKNMGDLPWTYDDMHVDFESQGLKVFKNQLVPFDDVKPGQSVVFDFWVQAPYQGGTHRLGLTAKYRRTTILGGNLKFNVAVEAPVLRAKIEENKTKDLVLKPGQEYEITVKYRNIGNVVWRNKGTNAVYIAPSSPPDRLSKMYNPKSWPNKYRAAVLKELLVTPGEVGTFVFKVRPTTRRTYREAFQLVMENVGWVEGSTVRYNIRVAGVGEKTTSNIDPLADSKLNQGQAALITKARPTKTVKPVTTTPTVTTTTSSPLSSSAADTKHRVTAHDDIRVKLSFNGDVTDVSYLEGFNVFDGSGTLLMHAGATQRVSVSRSGNSFTVKLGTLTKTAPILRFQSASRDGVFTVHSMERRPAWNQSLNDNKFRGTLEIQVVNNQSTYINELYLEDYMKGVAEVPNGEPFEKQKAMAVLARTYARYYMEDSHRKFPGLPYDGSDDPDVFQKYLGYGYEVRSPNFVGAAVVTEDEVVTYNGILVKTPYFTQSDGRTRSAEEVWGWRDTPWLKSVPDPASEGLEKKGHGVGLSGLGATKMAEAGKTYDEIIKYYYTGVKIEEKEL